MALLENCVDWKPSIWNYYLLVQIVLELIKCIINVYSNKRTGNNRISGIVKVIIKPRLQLSVFFSDYNLEEICHVFLEAVESFFLYHFHL